MTCHFDMSIKMRHPWNCLMFFALIESIYPICHSSLQIYFTNPLSLRIVIWGKFVAYVVPFYKSSLHLEGRCAVSLALLDKVDCLFSAATHVAGANRTGIKDPQ